MRIRSGVLAALVVAAAAGLVACGAAEGTGTAAPPPSASVPTAAQPVPDVGRQLPGNAGGTPADGQAYGTAPDQFRQVPPGVVPTGQPNPGGNPNGTDPDGTDQDGGVQDGGEPLPADDEGGGWWLWTTLLAALAVLAIAAVALFLRPRPTRRVVRPAPTTTVRVAAPPPPVAAAGVEAGMDDPFPVATTQAPSGQALRPTLRRVGDVAPSGAIAEQIRRLLDGDATREDLVDACIHYRDQLHERDPGLAAEIVRGLAAEGVTEVGADGEVFDSTVHDAVGSVPTDSSGLHDMIAETVRPGFRDGLRVVRPPEVVVFRHAHEPAGQDQ